MAKRWLVVAAKSLAVAAFLIIAVAAGLWMLFGFTYTYALKTSTGILKTGTVAALEYALRHGDAVYPFWPAFVVLVAVAGAAAVWHGKTAWVWAAGIMLAGVSFLGVWSIGGAVAPVAAALLAAAAASTWCGKFT